MKIVTLIFATIVLFVSSCKSDSNGDVIVKNTDTTKTNQKIMCKYEDAITEEVKHLKEELAVLETLPGYEAEKRAMRTNIAIAEQMNLDSYEMKFELDYFKKHGKEKQEEAKKDFRIQVEYDRHMKELKEIIENNK